MTRRGLNLLGAVILIAGLLAATCVWIVEDRNENRNNNVDELGLLDSRTQTRQLEVYSGHAGVVAEQWSEGLASLFHGKRLAATVAVGCSALGLGCMLVADYLLPSLQRGKKN